MDRGMDKIIECYDVSASKKHSLIGCSLQNLSKSKDSDSNQGNTECIRSHGLKEPQILKFPKIWVNFD